MADDRTYSEQEHFALLTDAVTREVAEATADATTEIDALKQRIDVLEAEKAGETSAKEKAEQDLADYRAQVEQGKEVDKRKDERLKIVKAASNGLPDGYYTDERVQRWAEMADEAFEALVDDLVEASIHNLGETEQAELRDLTGAARVNKLAEIKARNVSTNGTRETAAFAGGAAPSDPGKAQEGSTLSRYFGARGHVPVGSR